jgi:hypothetical protein
MTTETTYADVLATYRSRMANIEARDVPRLNYVLSWGDGRFIRIEDGKANVTGFEHATFFGDREAATVWLRKGLTDGAHVAPHAVLAFNAKQGALIVLQGVIDTVEGHAVAAGPFTISEA